MITPVQWKIMEWARSLQKEIEWRRAYAQQVLAQTVSTRDDEYFLNIVEAVDAELANAEALLRDITQSLHARVGP